MSEKTIGLAEFINQIKHDLLTESADTEQQSRLFMVDTVEVEMSIGATRSGKGGLNLYVLEAGGQVEAEHTQKVRVTLTPLLDRETRLRLLDPELSEAERKKIVRATVKGSGAESLKELP